MYVNIVSLQYKSGVDAEEAVKKIENVIVPEIRKVPGFQRFHLVRTSETTTMHIGVFDSADNAEAGRKQVYPHLRDAINDHLENPARVEHGDVRISA